MPQVTVYTDIEDNRWQKAIENIENVVEKVKAAAFEYVGENAKISVLKASKPLFIGLCLSNDDHVWELNRVYRNKDKPTNVLSFANLDFKDFATDGGMFEEIDLGNIIMAFETVEKEAQTENITIYAHFCHLLVHGFLHILGFDHIEEAEAQYMEGFEKEILRILNIENPYEEDEA